MDKKNWRMIPEQRKFFRTIESSDSPYWPGGQCCYMSDPLNIDLEYVIGFAETWEVIDGQAQDEGADGCGVWIG